MKPKHFLMLFLILPLFSMAQNSDSGIENEYIDNVPTLNL